MGPSSDFLKKYAPQIASFGVGRLAEINKRLEELKKEAEPLEEEKKELLMMVADLKVNKAIAKIKIVTKKAVVSRITVVGSKYDPQWSNMKKVIYFTRTYGWLTMLDIAAKIQNEQPDIDIKELKKSLSVVLSQDKGRKLNRRENKQLEKLEYMAK